MVQEGRFPAPIQLTSCRIGWRWSAIVQWLAEREADPIKARTFFGRDTSVKLVGYVGNGDDRALVLALLDGVEGGITLGDLGYRGKQRVEEWAEEGEMFVLTRAEAPEKKSLLAQLRQAIETSFSQLWYKFLDRVFSRSWRGLWNTLPLKVLHYNLRHAGVLSA